MRHGRAKAARRTLQFFQRVQGIRPPYHLLLDGNFLVACLKYKVPIQERLDKLLQHAELVFCVAQSTLKEMNALAAAAKEDKASILKQAHQWARENTRIVDAEEEDTEEGTSKLHAKLSEAGRDMMRLLRSEKYFLASQDEELLDLARNLGTTPIIRLAQGTVLLLEQPSAAATRQAAAGERKKWTVAGSVTEQEKVLVDVVKEQERKQKREQQLLDRSTFERRKKKAKGPNPLSCKKRKDESAQEQKAKRRKRKKSSGEAAA